MEHILISPGKLKLMLSKSDLEGYGLDCDSLDSEQTLTRRAFRTLLSDVKRVVGFDVENDKVFIQLYPSRDGGAEIYITRLHAATVDDGSSDVRTRTDVYRFSSLSALLSACGHAAASAPVHSSAWQDGGVYYLITTHTAKDAVHERLWAHLSAFGRRLKSDAADAFVLEHCTALVESDAVNTLARLA